MNTLIYISLALNVAVLLPIVTLMLLKSPIADKPWGYFTPARGILMSIYFSILLVSVFLLFVPVPAFVFALLVVQVIYKVTTPFTVGSFSNEVVISNLAISVVHVVTLFAIFNQVGSALVS
ncbi:MAG: hypothetical protein RIR46_653 [Actinomycetota bacterium]|jgi:hypothetical protein